MPDVDLAFVGGEGEQTKDLNPVLLAPLPDATTGRISSERKRDYGAMFRERSERPVGTTQKDAIQNPSLVFQRAFCPLPGAHEGVLPCVVIRKVLSTTNVL